MTAKTITVNDYVPMNLFGKDHWSTLAYIETVLVELGGFEIGFDPHMRQNRRHCRVMLEQRPRPRRVKRTMRVGCMWDPKYSTKLADGTLVDGHDDWSCVQDLAEAGFFEADGRVIVGGDCEPGETLHLSALGQRVAADLRTHKAKGGSFGNFKLEAEAA